MLKNSLQKKQCTGCKRKLLIREFGKRTSSIDGKNSYCKKCWSKICRKNRNNKLYHDCINMICELEDRAYTQKSQFNELYVLNHIKRQYWKVVDLAWEFYQKTKFNWPPGYEKPEYQKPEYNECIECGKTKPIVAFIQGYNVCQLCAKQQHVGEVLEETE